jgi:hypothetical protein
VIGSVLALAATLAVPNSGNTITYGPGGDSCASWIQESASAPGDNWIMRFWSGLNATGRYHDIGRSTDGAAITGEVRVFCQAHPSVALANATLTVYLMLRLRERPTTN